MSAISYSRFELSRTLRNRRLMLFSLGFPLLIYLAIALPGREVEDLGGTGISLPLYYMVGLVSFSAMMALITNGARIASERTTGWTRRLRVTPLGARPYIRAKVLTGYAVALLAIALIFGAGIALGVRLPAAEWARMTGLILIGLTPFAALGILLGHLLTADSIGPAAGGTASLLAIVSGNWFPLADGALRDVAEFLPSYWLVQASHVSVGGAGWSTTGWIVVAVWTAALVALAALAFRRDTERV